METTAPGCEKFSTTTASPDLAGCFNSSDFVLEWLMFSPDTTDGDVSQMCWIHFTRPSGKRVRGKHLERGEPLNTKTRR